MRILIAGWRVARHIARRVRVDDYRRIVRIDAHWRPLCDQTAAELESILGDTYWRSSVTQLAKLLAFRHLFRGASIALMRWNKLSPLVAKVNGVHQEFVRELTQFQLFLQISPSDPDE